MPRPDPATVESPAAGPIPLVLVLCAGSAGDGTMGGVPGGAWTPPAGAPPATASSGWYGQAAQFGSIFFLQRGHLRTRRPAAIGTPTSARIRSSSTSRMYTQIGGQGGA